MTSCNTCGMDLEGVDPTAHCCPSSVLDSIPLGSAVEERMRAKQWMNAAAGFLRDIDALKDELNAAKKDPLITMLEGMSREERLNFASAQRPAFAGGLHPATFIDELKPVDVVDDLHEANRARVDELRADFEASQRYASTCGSIAREVPYKRGADSTSGGGGLEPAVEGLPVGQYGKIT